MTHRTRARGSGEASGPCVAAAAQRAERQRAWQPPRRAGRRAAAACCVRAAYRRSLHRHRRRGTDTVSQQKVLAPMQEENENNNCQFQINRIEGHVLCTPGKHVAHSDVREKEKNVRKQRSQRATTLKVRTQASAHTPAAARPRRAPRVTAAATARHANRRAITRRRHASTVDLGQVTRTSHTQTYRTTPQVARRPCEGQHALTAAPPSRRACASLPRASSHA